MIEGWFDTTVESMADPPSNGTVAVQRGQGDRISQGYRKIGLEEALARLPQSNQGDAISNE